MANKSKRVVVISDLHCGHRVGLTPPPWQYKPVEDEPKRMKYLGIQQEIWGWYHRTIAGLRPIDALVVNGDLIEGTGSRSGAVELLTTDRNEQVAMASKCIQAAGAERLYVVHGTPYHCGEQEDWEDAVARECGAEKTGDHEWLEVNGLVLDFVHHIGGSNIPHGRATPLLRDALWNMVWADAEYAPRADVLIRSHVHHYDFAGSARGSRTILGMTTPALQGMGSRYGARMCRGTVDVGMVVFNITSREEWSWKGILKHVTSQVASIAKL